MARQWDKTDSRGKCPVCGQHATLDPQHITSQGNTEGANQQWLTKNQGKIVHICRKCHDQMTDSMMRNRSEKKAEAKPPGKSRSEFLCSRCGRTGHNRSSCLATTRADGSELWSPKTVKAKKKPER